MGWYGLTSFMRIDTSQGEFASSVAVPVTIKVLLLFLSLPLVPLVMFDGEAATIWPSSGDMILRAGTFGKLSCCPAAKFWGPMLMLE